MMALPTLDFGLKGKVVLVLGGGGKGIGESVALHFAAAGASLALADRDEASVRAVAARAEGGKPSIHIGDVTVRGEPERIIAETLAHWGRLDVLVNVVGTGTWANSTTMPEDWWEMDIRRNLSYVFYACRAAAKSMIEARRPGAIVNLGSTSAVAAPFHVGYSAAKAGIEGLTRTMAVEFGPYDIRVNAVAPGSIVNPHGVASVESRKLAQAAPARATPQPTGSDVPMATRGGVEHIATAVLFLASELSAFTSGQILTVDGAQSVNIYSHTRERFADMAAAAGHP